MRPTCFSNCRTRQASRSGPGARGWSVNLIDLRLLSNWRNRLPKSWEGSVVDVGGLVVSVSATRCWSRSVRNKTLSSWLSRTSGSSAPRLLWGLRRRNSKTWFLNLVLQAPLRDAESSSDHPYRALPWCPISRHAPRDGWGTHELRPFAFWQCQGRIQGGGGIGDPFPPFPEYLSLSVYTHIELNTSIIIKQC